MRVNPDFFRSQVVPPEGWVEILIRLAARRDGATTSPTSVGDCENLATRDPSAAAQNANNIVQYIMNYAGLRN